jgi:hypothetical protein
MAYASTICHGEGYLATFPHGRRYSISQAGEVYLKTSPEPLSLLRLRCTQKFDKILMLICG